MKLNRRVTIITRFSGIMFSLLLLGGLAACSDDNNGNDTPEPEPSTYPTTPFSKIELKEVIESDAQPVTATHTYLYNSAGRLTGYTGKQSFTAGDELFEIENTTTVEYKDHQAVITDEAGTVSTYTLNDKGYATTCTSQDMAGNTRTYTFSYLINTEDKYYLENITEKLDDGKEYSFITIATATSGHCAYSKRLTLLSTTVRLPHHQAMKLQISPKYQAYSLRTCIRFPCMRLPYTGRYWENLQTI